MSEKLSNEDKENIIISDCMTIGNYDLILPANEYWLSKCIEQNISNISNKAKKN